VSRPLIGITTYHRDRRGRHRFQVPTSYVDAVRAAGGAPLLLPPGEPEPGRLLDVVQGVVFAGGGDVHPARFAAAPNPASYAMCEERDAFEFALMESVLARALPTLAICRGTQVLNVLLGGDLIGHLPDHVGERVVHRASREQHARHAVRLDPGSRLASLYGTDSLEVSSWHHQAVGRLGRGLRPVAWAEDGVVEAVELDGAPWLQAVQWHPELETAEGSPERRLFASFIEAARSVASGAPALGR
jgi:putative glutamine amidotransferase